MFGVVREVDRHLGIVRAELFESVLVRVVELGAVGTHEDCAGVDEVEEIVGHVGPAPVVGQLEQVDLQLRLAPLGK